MIPGYATPEATAALPGRHAPMVYGFFGKTGLLTSQAGFGCYRITPEVARHRQSLRLALVSGINLIDTSTNYADGDSESLVGSVLTELIEAGELKREEVVVVSKVGYLQGKNYARSQARSSANQPYPELVTVSEGLEHCIHPEFIASQLTESLNRLGLGTIDAYLLHNPEYYLGWAHQSGMEPDEARREYHRRIRQAFVHLELEVAQGRIRWYGVSSNTFPVARADSEFTALSALWEMAEDIHTGHHFRIIQFPMNLLETGAVLVANQPDSKTVLEFAFDHFLAVMINRPLNAFSGNALVRLADPGEPERLADHLITARIGAVGGSEARFWRHILPDLEIPDGLKVRLKEQLCIADTLKHYWRNFSSYERWRQTRDGHFNPRIEGVMAFLQPHAAGNPELLKWMSAHETVLSQVFEAIGSFYADMAKGSITALKRALSNADSDWAESGTLSQKAVRALRTTQGISVVLVGMRHPDYVADVLEELRRYFPVTDRKKSWQDLR
ncbi:MAG: aldo/keto reductase [Deltaproteobacteria bacterium]|nr:aldo/keto reductase [Deltaproteobacteria bacterium]